MCVCVCVCTSVACTRDIFYYVPAVVNNFFVVSMTYNGNCFPVSVASVGDSRTSNYRLNFNCLSPVVCAWSVSRSAEEEEEEELIRIYYKQVQLNIAVCKSAVE